MYFPLFELYGWGKRSGIQPKTIYSEVPKIPIDCCLNSIKAVKKRRFYGITHLRCVNQSLSRLIQQTLHSGCENFTAAAFLLLLTR